jgi:molybdate transport system substrate-binding protein
MPFKDGQIFSHECLDTTPIMKPVVDAQRRQTAWLLLGALLSASAAVRAQNSPGADPPAFYLHLRLAAATNLQPALAELVPLFERQHRAKVALTLGASANLVRQIQQGLAADLFLSADEEFAFRLADAGLTLGRGVVYATGRLALVVPVGSKLPLDARLAGVKAASAQIEKFALANPELAPYGRAGREALQKQGIWPALEGKVVIGESIAQATQYVSSGAAQAGLTALALALVPEVAARTRHVVVDESLHAPIRQRMVLLKTAGPGAQAFYVFMQTAEARAVLGRFGYR